MYLSYVIMQNQWRTSLRLLHPCIYMYLRVPVCECLLVYVFTHVYLRQVNVIAVENPVREQQRGPLGT